MNECDALNPLVSVIVTTRNEERNISNCLKSIQLQTYKPIEMIVVDNNSTDRTQEIALSYTDVVVNKGPERSAQRNHGICDLATGKYAMFIDADMILTPTLIETCVREIQREGVVALHIEEVILGIGKLAKIRRYERSFYSGTVIDGARFFLRSRFSGIGGFDVDLPPGPEDWDLDKRLKKFGEILLVNSAGEEYEWELHKFIKNQNKDSHNGYIGIYHNEGEQTLRSYLSKKRYYSPSMNAYIAKWGTNDPDVQKQLGMMYRYVIVFLEKSKYKKTLLNPVITLEMLFLRMIVGAIYLVEKRAKVIDTNAKQA
jgi:glycosyltransferase involved in cell wall biosynthesis